MKENKLRERNKGEPLEAYIDHILKDLYSKSPAKLSKFRNKRNKCLNHFMVNSVQGNHIMAKLRFLNGCRIIPYSDIDKNEAKKYLENQIINQINT